MIPCLEISLLCFPVAILAISWPAPSSEAFPESSQRSAGTVCRLPTVSREDTLPWPHFCCQRSLWNEQAVWGCHGEAGPFWWLELCSASQKALAHQAGQGRTAASHPGALAGRSVLSAGTQPASSVPSPQGY